MPPKWRGWPPRACGATQRQALVLSTGIIGEFLPMEKIAAGIRAAATRLAASDEALVSAARGMLTTDTVHKLAGRELAHRRPDHAASPAWPRERP